MTSEHHADKRQGTIILRPKRPQKVRRERVPVLVLLHSDGHVEIFGNERIDVHVATMLNTPAESLAERYLEEHLPDRFRRVYWPAMVRGRGNVRQITPGDELKKIQTLGWLRAIRSGEKKKNEC